MYVPLLVDVTAALCRPGERNLAVVIDAAPVSEPQVGRTSRVSVHKARMGYGWDFCPRLVHQGLWQPVRLRGPADSAPAGTLPYHLVVNGRPVYLTGWNWVPVDALYGAADPARVRHLLGLARDAGVTMLRVWGGGLIETPQFYDLCDAYGILVWQEFAQSSSGMESVPSENPAFVARMAAEAEAIVPARRNSASLAIWCGGNELQGLDGVPLTEADSPVLAALRDTVRRLDPDRHWFPTSPSGPVFANTLETVATDRPQHDVHGPWEHQGLRDQYRLYDRGRSLLLSEFDVEGMSNLRAVLAVVPAENRRLPTMGDAVWDHLGRWWNNEDVVQDAFGGELADLAELARASQQLQADGLRYAIEANRRRAASCGVLPWQLNESFPNGWCTAAVDYFGEPKAAYHAVRRAYRPLHVCAKLDTAAWGGRDRLSTEIWAWSADGPLSGTVTARLVTVDGTVLHERSWPAQAAEGTAYLAGVLVCELDRPEDGILGLDRPEDGILVLDLTVQEDHRRSTSRQQVSTGSTFAALRHLDRARVDVDVSDDGPDAWRLRLRHRGGPMAAFVQLLDDRPAGVAGWLVVGDSGFDLLPGEERTVPIRWTDVAPAQRRLRLDGWNIDPSVVSGPP